MNIGTANYVITRQIQNSNIPFKYQVNLPRNTPVGLPKAFQRKTNWKYWIKYIKPIWCPQHLLTFSILYALRLLQKCQTVLQELKFEAMKALYILIRQSRGTYFKILRKAFVWRAALVHKREIWSSKHNLSSSVTPSNLTHDTGFIVSFDIFNSQIASSLRCLKIIVWNFEGFAFIWFSANQSKASLALASSCSLRTFISWIKD